MVIRFMPTASPLKRILGLWRSLFALLHPTTGLVPGFPTARSHSLDDHCRFRNPRFSIAHRVVLAIIQEQINAGGVCMLVDISQTFLCSAIKCEFRLRP